MRLVNLVEGAALALDQLRANRSRSALTILGVVIGVAVVMAMSAMVAGVRSSVVSAMLEGGAQNFSIMRYDPNAALDLNRHGPPWGRNPRITAEEVERVGQLPAVKLAVAQLYATGDISYAGQRITDLQVNGSGAAWPLLRGSQITRGHNFRESDVSAARPVAVLSEQLGKDLFGPLDPVGRRVRMNGQSFDVIGLYRPADNMFAGDDKHRAFVPYPAASKYLNAWDDFMNVDVRPVDDGDPAMALDQVTTLLRTMRGLRPGEPNNFAVVKIEEFVSTFNRLTAVFFIVMIALSSVALTVGGVGVIAIMMIAVTERTREIGIRKAVGATEREILFQFLIEAVTVTLIGSAIGMAIGGVLSFAIARLTPIPARVPAGAVVAALGMAAFAGVVFGLWPAWRAARMDPVEALRYE